MSRDTESGGTREATVGEESASAGGTPVAVAPERALRTVAGAVPGRILAVCLAAVGVGLAAFFLGLESTPKRAWQAAWVNFLFWTSIAGAGAVFGAVLQTAKGHWGKEFLRIAHGAAAFLPAALVIFLLLYLGAGEILPWIQDTGAHVNRTWLQKDLVFLRNGVLLLLLSGLGMWYLKLSLRPDAPLVAEEVSGWRRRLLQWLGRNWRGAEAEVRRSRRILGRLSPVFVLAFTAIFSLLAVDMALSLIPGFISIIWGAYFFVGAWLALLGFMAVMANRYYWQYGLGDVWDRWQFHDLGKLFFAFTIFWTYLWWSQFLVIWYGNLPRETIFFEQRTAGGYGPLYVLQMILVFGIPFVLLLFRRPKMNPGYLAFVGVISLSGLWLERFLLVSPSVFPGGEVPLGWIEVGVTVGFLGLFALCYALFSSTFPKIPIRETLITGEAGTGP